MAETISKNDKQSPTTQLDHIIILISPKDFENIPSWISDNFTIIEGGTHSKGTSRNKLIIFKDGTYLELFSWTNPQPEGVPPYADFPAWAPKPEGCVIDWALTGDDAEGTYQEVIDGLQRLADNGETTHITYDAPTIGGRKRKDGKELKWSATRPRPTDSTSMSVDVPFFCHDITPRVLRVPNRSESTGEISDITSHPCGATGVAGLVIEVAAPNLERCTQLYEAVLGGGNAIADRREGAALFSIAVPDADPTFGDSHRCSLHLQVPDEDHRFSLSLPGTSIRRLVLFTDIHERKGDQLDRDDFGTHINLC